MIQVLPRFKSCCLLFASLIVGCALLPRFALAAASPDRAPMLVGEARAQFQLVYRLRPAEGLRRQEQLNAVVAAWRAAPHTDANNERLNNWLRAAIRASMPGSRDALPVMPTFTVNAEREQRGAERTPVEVRTPEPTPAAKSATAPTDEANLDPFRDDPEVEQEVK